ncbi:MAG: uracil-DNA glycosylase [Campylobacterota bacterium]|nr:uracil-DNA glycosylase [Campylobacterota bacterium]
MNWEEIIDQERSKEYFVKLHNFVDEEYKNHTVYPQKQNIFKAFELSGYDNLKVVILGQDPYHGADQAQGLAFSTPSNIKNPPSMVNILKEIQSDIEKESSCKDGDLTPWAKQGVLLINTILTVREAQPKSHEKKGWEIFTDNIIKHISQNKENIIFLLWGAPAIKKTKLIDENKHIVLTAPHPSPLSAYRGFFGCKHFSKTNEILRSLEKDEINW